MADWLFSSLDATNYIVSNTYCLFATMEFWALKLLILLSYVDLLVDISETFCIMIALMVIISSSVATLTQVHAISNSKTNKFINSVAYAVYVKFLQFKNRL